MISQTLSTFEVHVTSLLGARTVAAGFRGWHVANQFLPWARLAIAIAVAVHRHLA